jgi:hypothetical protein
LWPTQAGRGGGGLCTLHSIRAQAQFSYAIYIYIYGAAIHHQWVHHLDPTDRQIDRARCASCSPPPARALFAWLGPTRPPTQLSPARPRSSHEPLPARASPRLSHLPLAGLRLSHTRAPHSAILQCLGSGKWLTGSRAVENYSAVENG